VNAREQLVDVVVPVFDEEQTLVRNVEELLAYLRAEFPCRYRIVVADNASTDGTAAIGAELARQNDEVGALPRRRYFRGGLGGFGGADSASIDRALTYAKAHDPGSRWTLIVSTSWSGRAAPVPARSAATTRRSRRSPPSAGRSRTAQARPRPAPSTTVPARPLRSPPRVSAQFGRFLAVGLSNTALSSLAYTALVTVVAVLARRRARVRRRRGRRVRAQTAVGRSPRPTRPPLDSGI